MKQQLKELAKRWETLAMSCDVLAGNAAGSGDYTTETRCKTKAGMFRSLAGELKQEISMIEDEEKRMASLPHPIINCPDCGEFRNFGHVCKLPTNDKS
jgi:hypothetical protein